MEVLIRVIGLVGLVLCLNSRERCTVLLFWGLSGKAVSGGGR